MLCNTRLTTEVASTRGSLFYLDGQKVLEIAWGLDTASDKKVEALVALQGINVLPNHGIHKASIVKDSAIIICSLPLGKLLKELRVAKMTQIAF